MAKVNRMQIQFLKRLLNYFTASFYIYSADPRSSSCEL